MSNILDKYRTDKTDGVGNSADSGRSVNPPGVKRGWDSQSKEKSGSVGIHWLRGSVEKDKLQLVIDYFDHWFGEHESREFGYWVYDRSEFWPVGSVALNYLSEESGLAGDIKHGSGLTKGKITFEIPGHALDYIGKDDLQFFLYDIDNFGGTIGRIDLYYDDPNRHITPRKLYQMIYDEEDCGKAIKYDFTGFKSIDYHSKGGHAGRQYDCVAFGSRGSHGSGAYLRFYDKYLESGGNNPACRWELELSGEKAQKAFSGLLAVVKDVDKLTKMIGMLVGGCIDFIHRDSGDKNLSRCLRYDFWEKILAEIGSAKIQLQRPKTTIERTQNWLSTQTPNGLRALRDAKGEEEFYKWFFAIMDDQTPHTPRYQMAIIEFQKKMERQEKFDLIKIKDHFLSNDVEVTFEDRSGKQNNFNFGETKNGCN